jgi:carbamoyltransferase
MLIAGISGFERNAAVALYRDGDLVAVCEEGRVRRVRDLGMRGGGFPRVALEVALQTIGVRHESVQEFVYAEPGVESLVSGPASGLDHHYAHAATAFFTSPYEESLILVCDSSRSRELSVWRGRGATLEPVDVPWTGPAFATLYSRLTSLLGFEAGCDEYLVEALARATAW